MKLLIFTLGLLIAGFAEAKMYGKIAKCTRTDISSPDAPKTVFYILTSAFNGDHSKPDDGLMVMDTLPDIDPEPAGLAATVDIVLNTDGSYTIPNGGIYGDSYTFKANEVIINQGKFATHSCEMTEQ
ncbi:MAG: hypothetical protein IT287_10090 [Bdellovibrionaceae bacterium]|nr:hypothetical protein [Pseudobdellovibrionaceae bacterium]